MRRLGFILFLLSTLLAVAQTNQSFSELDAVKSEDKSIIGIASKGDENVGKYNSSETRVRPIFDKLLAQDPTGQQWLTKLLKMGSRAGQMTVPSDVGCLVEEKRYEFSVNPPKSFLEWLLVHRNELQMPADRFWKEWSPDTQQKREKFMDGDEEVLTEALDSLHSCKKMPDRTWWRLEGVTKVDCALITATTVVFIEGKRTEMGASKDILWYPQRNQVLRNLDCAAELARQTGRPNYFVLLVVEKPLVEADPIRQQEIKAVEDMKTVDESLPHLSKGERAELMRHYLGYTTWQDIVDGFSLPKELLE